MINIKTKRVSDFHNVDRSIYDLRHTIREIFVCISVAYFMAFPDSVLLNVIFMMFRFVTWKRIRLCNFVSVV